MFSPVPMMRLSVLVLERDERTVLRDLGQREAVQFARVGPATDTAALTARGYRRELTECDRLLARVGELRQSLGIDAAAAAPAVTANFSSKTLEPRNRCESQGIPLTQPAGTLSPSGRERDGVRGSASIPQYRSHRVGGSAGLSMGQAGEQLRPIEARAGELLRRRQGLVQRQGELTLVHEQVADYSELDIPLDQIDRFSFLHFVVGTLPAGGFADLQGRVDDNVALLPLPARAERQPLIAMTTRSGGPALESALEQAGFERNKLPAIEGATPQTLCAESSQELDRVQTDLQTVEEAVRALATEATGLLAEIEQLAGTERRLLEARQGFLRSEAAVLLAGWVPAEDVPALEQRLREITGGRCAIEANSPADLPEEQIPVLLRHPRLIRPFAMLVTAYGLPKYRELEPTLFLALSYVLMFGMMFGDAGHGAVLALGGLIAMAKGRTAQWRDAGWLLLFGGLSSIGFGVVYGSYFGLTQLKHYALWHDPLEGDPMGLISLAIGFGVVVISLGLVLNIINRFRRGDWLGGLLDKFGVLGVVFYWGTLALVAKFAALESRGLVQGAILLFVALPLVGWAVKEPLEFILNRRAGHPVEPGGGLGAAITESLVGAFEGVLVYLANTISFVRLAAYAMSHAALLMAAFVMAAEVERFSPGGSLLSVLVIILGNGVAIVLEGIIASVQALRLEYYEFFGKFYSGSGRPFQPFSLRAGLKIAWDPAARDFGGGQGGEAGASPLWAVRAEPTPATDKRPAGFVAPRSETAAGILPRRASPSHLRPANRTPTEFSDRL